MCQLIIRTLANINMERYGIEFDSKEKGERI